MNPLVLRSPALSDQVQAVIGRQIVSGERPAGSRLPTEVQLAEEFGVSRTVVREAVARLRSEGLVFTRQGLGAFVADSLQALPFRLEASSGDTRKDIRELFELRLGLESEAAAYAAQRGTKAQIKAIGQAIDTMVTEMHAGRDGVKEDFQFHRAIALATNNTAYQNFLAFLERHIRDQLVVTRASTQSAGLIGDVEIEHRRIYEAIKAGNVAQAREASRQHLENGIRRLVSSGQV
jgi:GntR family transcriptional regulator, transcriptional repressor for pyruvate dehydrogenase complex